MPERRNVKDNIFERHPGVTSFFVILIIVFTLDFFVAKMYTLINGYPFSKLPEEIERTYRIHSRSYHHDLARNKCVNGARWGYITYKVCTNSLGFKDNNVRVVPLASEKDRILFIGDSFTEGLGVEYKDTFVGLIGSELSEGGIEVLNAAVLSYSPAIYWRKIKYLIEDVGLKFNEVVVFIDLSDIDDEANVYRVDEFDNVLNVNPHVFAQEGAIKVRLDEPGRIWSHAKLLLSNNSILMYFILRRIRHVSQGMVFYKNIDELEKRKMVWNSGRCNWTIDKEVYEEYGEKGLKKAELYMDKLHDLLSGHGIGLTIAVYPWPEQIYYGDLDSIQVSFWNEWCAKHNVNFINYFPYFVTCKNAAEAKSVIERFFIKGEYHWNENGHRLVADVFLDFYSKQSKILKKFKAQ
ncbi:MAG: hypothetical protein PHN49_01300 [Candidatus Omnitrophica bacterium]|nr:hypothetical protein [Candidatus Omnitrophota bacterium]